MGQDPNVDNPEALCSYLENRSKDEDVNDGDVGIFGLEVQYMSYVDDPAVDSVFLKSKKLRDQPIPEMDTKDRHGRKMKSKASCSKIGTGMFIKSELDDKNFVVKGVALIPDTVDGNGEFISEEEIYKAALKFMDFQKVDSQHDFEEGKGDVVFNWILEEEKSFELRNGGAKTYPKGTWIVGTKVKDPKEWELIKSGQRTGFSIAGYWSGLPVKKSKAEPDQPGPCPVCGSSDYLNNESQSPSMKEESIQEVKTMEDEEIVKLVNETTTKALKTFVENAEQEEARKLIEAEKAQAKEDLATALKKIEDMEKALKEAQDTIGTLKPEAKEDGEEDDDEEDKEDMEDDEEEEKSIEDHMVEEKSILHRATKSKPGPKSGGQPPNMKTVIQNYKGNVETKLE